MFSAASLSCEQSRHLNLVSAYRLPIGFALVLLSLSSQHLQSVRMGLFICLSFPFSANKTENIQ